MSSLPEKFIIPEKRIPKAFSQGLYNDCVAITLTKILEVINYVKTGEYVFLSKGYTYGRNNRPDKTQGGSDYEYMLNMLKSRGSVPEEMCPERDEIPEIRKKLEARSDIAELDKIAEDYKILSWEKIHGNVYKLDNIKKCLYEHQMPLAGNMTGNRQHSTVIVGYDEDKLLYQDHDKDGKLRTISHNKFNGAYYIDGGINRMSSFRSFDIEEFKNYVASLNVSRSISRIQLHHTYSPSYAQFTGNNHNELQTGMQRCHIKTNGWSDIAQHFTVFPDGIILSGRSMEMIPAGIKGANTGAVCIECLGNFDVSGDVMTAKQKMAVVAVIKILADKFGLNARDSVAYHGWWTSSGKNIGDYDCSKSVKTCPGTNFFGGNSREAFEKNLLPLIEKYGTDVTERQEQAPALQAVESINDIVWEISNAGIIADGALWMNKCEEDINVYWLCRKMANYLRGTL